MGKLQVCICAARNLHDNQVFGTPDPYCRVRMGDHEYKTKVVNNSLNPVWNETFRFQVADESTAQLCVELWNKNIISDDLMGTYNLSLSHMTRGVVHDDWYMLGHSKTNAELHLRVLACDFGSNPHPSDAWKITTDINNDPALGAGKKPPSAAAPVTIASNVNNTPIDPRVGPAVIPTAVLMQSQSLPQPQGYHPQQPMHFPAPLAAPPGYYPQQPMYYPSQPPVMQQGQPYPQPGIPYAGAVPAQMMPMMNPRDAQFRY